MNSIDARKLLWKEIAEDPQEVHAGLYRAFPPLTALHTHEFYEAFLIAEGSILHRLGREGRTKLVQGHLVFVRPDDCHGFLRDAGENCFMLNLAFTADVLREVCHFLRMSTEAREALDVAMGPPALILPDETCHAFTSQLVDAASQPIALKQTILRAVLAEWLLMFHLPPHEQPLQGPQWLVEVCAAMRRKENFLQGVERLQELAGLSPEHIARSFRKHLGITPSQFVNEQKLQFAAQLLQVSDLPVIEVAYEAGFGSLSYFSRLFVRRYSVTPGEMRHKSRITLAPTM